MDNKTSATLPCLCTALRTAAHEATQHYDRALESVGISVTMYRLLKNISDHDVPSLTNLAMAMGLDRSTLGRNVRVLERQGLARLENGDDGRIAVAALTEAGETALHRARRAWAEAQVTFADRLGPDCKTVLGALARLTKPADDNPRKGLR